MKKQKLKNTHFKQPFLNPFQVGYFAFLLLFFGVTLPSFAQDVNPCGSIQVIGTSEGVANNNGAPFQGIVVRNEVTPNQAIKIYNENWEQINECSSNECGNPYTFATGEGRYFVQVQLFNEDETWLCQADPFEVTVSETGDPCAAVCQQAQIVLATQAEVDAFCGCESVAGNLVIGNVESLEMTDITSLAALKDLKEVGKDLLIFRTQITDLQDLSNVTTIGGSLVMESNAGLSDLRGLDNLKNINGGLVLFSHDNLTSLAGLNLDNLTFFTSTNNPALSNLAAINNFTQFNSISILGPHPAAILDGFSNLTRLGNDGVGNSLFIGGVNNLVNLDGLSNLTQISGNVIIENNEGLANCCAISHLIDDDSTNGAIEGTVNLNNNRAGCNSVEEILANCQISTPDCNNISLSINSNNAGTIDIAGLVTPHYIVKVYDEDWNQILSCTDDCAFVGAYEAGLYRIHVQLYDASWQYICETEFLEINIGETGCDAPQAICQGDITLATQAEVDAFCGCEVIEGNLRIGGNNPTDISSIRNLASLTKVTGFIAIFNTDLPQLYGLHNLKTIEGDLVLDKNRSLVHLNGLDELNTIGNALVVNNNPALETLDGLNHLTALGTFNISDNPELTSIQILKNITEVSAFSIFANRKLASIEGLNNLVKIGDGVPSGGNGFALGIGGNPALTSLAPLANLREVDEGILINQNGALSNCCAISQLIDTDPSNGQALGEIQISDNGENCNSVEEILAHCQGIVPSCEAITVTGDNGQITIGNLVAPIEIVKIYDKNWNRVFECNNNCADPTVFETEAGKYYVQVQLYTADWKWICQTGNIEVTVSDDTNPTPTCDDIIVTISDLIIENGQARREVSVTFNTPNEQRTGVTLLKRSNNEVVLDCSICEEDQYLTLEEGEYVLLTDRSYLDLSNGNLGCGDIIPIDVPATPCTDNDGDYICAYNECDDNDAENTDLKFPGGPCDDEVIDCDNIIVKIGDIQSDNGVTFRNIHIDIFPPENQVTLISITNRVTLENYYACGLDCSPIIDINVPEGQYVIQIVRHPQGDAGSRLACERILFMDVPPTLCTDDDGDFLCDNPCDNISLSLDENNPGLIYVNGRSSQIQLLTLYDSRWNKIWDGTCDKGDPLSTCNVFGVHPPGLYRVYVRMYDENWQYICETDFLEIEIPEEGSSSRENEKLLNEKDLLVFPNPAQLTLNLKTKSLQGKKGSIQIFNTFGQQIAFIPEKEFTEQYEAIDVSTYQNGLYFISIKVNNQRAISKRFFVEKLE